MPEPETTITHERNGYWTAACYREGCVAVGRWLHTEAEAQEWLRVHAAVWATVCAMVAADQEPRDDA